MDWRRHASAALKGVSFAALALALVPVTSAPAQTEDSTAASAPATPEDSQLPEELRPSSELPPPDGGAVFFFELPIVSPDAQNA